MFELLICNKIDVISILKHWKTLAIRKWYPKRYVLDECPFSCYSISSNEKLMEFLLESGIWGLVGIWSHRLCLFALSSSLPLLRRTKLKAKPSVSSTPACVFARRPPGVGGISLTRATQPLKSACGPCNKWLLQASYRAFWECLTPTPL